MLVTSSSSFSPARAAGQLLAPSSTSTFMHEKEAPRTVERKRKGRMVDVVSFLPTPPRTRDTRLDSSPQSQTKHAAAGRRRPGLTFAQQMGLHGPGVGMGGGMRTALIPAAAIVPSDDVNPFGATSPPLLPLSPSATPIASKKIQVQVQVPPSPPPTIRQKLRVSRPNARPTLPGDEESNPFYAPPSKASTSASASALALQTAQRRAARQRFEESETITYVHRGSKRVFANPFLSQNHHASTLDERDENFSPNPNPQPKLLFPHPPRAPRHLDDEDDEEEEVIAVPRRLFGLKRAADGELSGGGKRLRDAF